jgi:hypothetical protein
MYFSDLCQNSSPEIHANQPTLFIPPVPAGITVFMPE